MQACKPAQVILLVPFLIYFATYFTGCVTGGVTPETIPLTSNPTLELSATDSELDHARKNQVDLLSPTWFEMAETNFGESMITQAEGGELSEIFEDLATSRAQLDRARELAGLSRMVLKSVIKERKAALAAGADVATTGFVKAETWFNALTVAIEDDDRSKAESERDDLAKAFRQVEITAIQDNALTKTRTLFSQVLNNGGMQYIPVSLAKAGAAIEDVEKFVAANRYDKAGISKLTRRAYFLTCRSYELNREVIAIAAETPEETALRMENRLKRVGKALRFSNLTNRPLDRQLDVFTDRIQFLQNSRRRAAKIAD